MVQPSRNFFRLPGQQSNGQPYPDPQMDAASLNRMYEDYARLVQQTQNQGRVDPMRGMGGMPQGFEPVLTGRQQQNQQLNMMGALLPLDMFAAPMMGAASALGPEARAMGALAQRPRISGPGPLIGESRTSIGAFRPPHPNTQLSVPPATGEWSALPPQPSMYGTKMEVPSMVPDSGISGPPMNLPRLQESALPTPSLYPDSMSPVQPSAMGPEDVMPADRFVPPMSSLGPGPAQMGGGMPSSLPPGAFGGGGSMRPPMGAAMSEGPSAYPWSSDLPSGAFGARSTGPSMAPGTPPPSIAAPPPALRTPSLGGATEPGIGSAFDGWGKEIGGQLAGLGRAALGAVGLGGLAAGIGSGGGFREVAQGATMEGGTSSEAMDIPGSGQADPGAQGVGYTVQRGNNLSALAQSMLGGNASQEQMREMVRMIASMSGIAPGQEDNLEIGQKLQLPMPAGVNPNQYTRTRAPAPAPMAPPPMMGPPGPGGSALPPQYSRRLPPM
jgi:hypothetical protein